MRTQKLSAFFTWLDANILLIFSVLLFICIPLFPKIPLFDILPGYIVRVRIEDFLVAIALGIYLLQVLRKKTTLKIPLAIFFMLYGIAGMASIISAISITQTVPLDTIHIQKTVLHYLRNLQYFSLFFITYAAIQKRKDVAVVLIASAVALAGVGIYAVGQKYLYWPVYSTMNREFSKGIRLYLTEHARVQSTFGGHYDLAAYLVFALPFVLSFALSLTNTKHKTAFWALFVLASWVLVVSASRTSFVAALLVLEFTIFLFALRQQQIFKKLRYFIKNSVIVMFIFTILMVRFGDDMYERLLHVLEGYPTIHRWYHDANAKRKYVLYEYLPQKIGLNTLFPTLKITPPTNGVGTDEIDGVMVPSDQQPIPQRPSDVYVDVPDLVPVATTSATGETEIVLIETPRTYSDNALKYGLSMAIRLDTLWPQALQGFYRNPLLGSGYGTLTKSEVYEFTEADSTDNNFLRTLGEVGLLGFILYYGIIAKSLFKARQLFTSPKAIPLSTAIGIGYTAGTCGLLLNAIYIDVFVASKVAFTFWGITGLVIALTTKKNLQKVIR